ncbi:hypothetical protein D3C80_1883590 [compost metagenome]
METITIKAAGTRIKYPTTTVTVFWLSLIGLILCSRMSDVPTHIKMQSKVKNTLNNAFKLNPLDCHPISLVPINHKNAMKI